MMMDGKLKCDDVIIIGGKYTTPGRLALAHALPAPMRDHKKLLYDKTFRLDGKNMKALLSEVARKHEKEYPKTVDAWKEYGYKLAYLNGSSFSLNDFHDGRGLRDQILRPHMQKERRVHRSSMSKAKKDAAIVQILQEANQDLERYGKARYERLSSNRMYEWAKSGAKGKWDQFSQLVMGPMIVSDAKNNPVAVPITRSFGEGLPASQYWASLHGARKGTIDRVSSTADPGALTKDIINTAMGYHVTSKDCGTTKGTFLSPLDADVVDRYLAQTAKLKSGSIPAGTLLTSQILQRVRNSGVKKLVVRSALHCEMASGVCAMCYGLNEKGKLHEPGTNVGVIAGHSLGEPVTQMQMRTFHTGGAGTENLSDAFQAAKDLFMVPSKLKGSAILAKASGTVESITTDPVLGGKIVRIGGKDHTTPPQNKLLRHIKRGAKVQRGAPITVGRVNPLELLKETGSIKKVRNHITSSLSEVYPGGVRRRNIETVVKAMTNLTLIKDPQGNDDLLRGQYMPLSEVEDRNRKAKVSGTPQILHTPTIKPMNYIPLTGQEDWMARLNYQRLKGTYEAGAAQGWSSDIHGHPISGLAHGAEFGLRPIKGAKYGT